MRDVGENQQLAGPSQLRRLILATHRGIVCDYEDPPDRQWQARARAALEGDRSSGGWRGSFVCPAALRAPTMIPDLEQALTRV
jgi:hypothetical protein